MTRVLLIGIAIALAITLAAQSAPRAEPAQKARTAQGQKSAGGNDKGIAWVSGDGGTRGYSQAGKGLKARTTRNRSFPPSRLKSMLVNSADTKAKGPRAKAVCAPPGGGKPRRC